MATTTTKLALTKPDGTDLVDIAVLNANADKIDTASGAFICTSTTRPASPWNGQLIFETDTLNALVYRTSSTSWNIVGGSTVSENPPANAGNGNFWWDSDNGKLYIYYNDGNTAQWVSANSNTSGVPIVGNEAGRNSLYPTPAQGNSVFRNDLGTTETYYGLHNASTNPGGRAVAGWYNNQRNIGLVPIVPPTVSVSGGTATANTLGVVSFTGATTVSLNGVFSSQYTNYRIVWRINTSASTTLVARLRASGTDNTGASSYVTAGQYFRSNSTNAAFSGITTAWSISSINSPAVGRAMGTLDLSSPNISSQTVGTGNSLGHDSTSSMAMFTGYLHSVTTSYDGITFLPNSGTITGEIQVFGYND